MKLLKVFCLKLALKEVRQLPLRKRRLPGKMANEEEDRERLLQIIRDHTKRSDEHEDEFCWNWENSVRTDGYPQGSLNGRHVAFHRETAKAFIGQIDGKLVHHECRNRRCLN